MRRSRERGDESLTAIGITCGVGSMLVGARQAGFKVLGNVEWRKYYHREDERGQNTFTSNFEEAAFPYSRERMTEDEFRRFSNPHLAMGHPESIPDQEILTRTGWRLISMVKVGDEVATHQGRFREVLAVYNRPSRVGMQRVVIRRDGYEPVVFAGNHPLLMWDHTWRKAHTLVGRVHKIVVLDEGRFRTIMTLPLEEGSFALDEPLYDLSVDEDNSYIVKSIVCKNCGGYSKLNMVNKNFREKKKDAGDIPLFADLVAQFRPRFFAMDDLPDSFIAFPMSEYHERLKDYDLFPEWVSNYHYGNVQKNRKRMFMIGALRDEQWAFVPGEAEHGLVLRDVLEDLGEPRLRGSNIANHDVHSLDAVSPRGQHLDTLGRGRDATYRDLRDWFLSNPEGTILRYISSDGTVKVKPSHASPYWEGHAHVLDGASLHMHPKRGTPFTIRERARIQGFPDDFIFYGTRYEPDGTYSHESNNDLIKQTGKAMPIQFCGYVARQVAAKIRGEPFESSGARLIAPNPMVDAAKLWYCSTVGYSDQARACDACWLREGCSLRPRAYVAPALEKPAGERLARPGKLPRAEPQRAPAPPRVGRFTPLAEGAEYDLKFTSET